MTTLNDAQLQEALDKSPSGVRVTPEMMKRRISRTEFHELPGTTVIICSITLDNGYSVRGEYACVDPKNFNRDIGRTIAQKNAFEQLWPLFGFLIAEMRFAAGVQADEDKVLKALGQEDGL